MRSIITILICVVAMISKGDGRGVGMGNTPRIPEPVVATDNYLAINPIPVPDDLSPFELATIEEDDEYWYYWKFVDGAFNTYKQSKIDNSNMFISKRAFLAFSSGWLYFSEYVDYRNYEFYRTDLNGMNREFILNYNDYKSDVGLESHRLWGTFVYRNSLIFCTNVYGIICYNMDTKVTTIPDIRTSDNVKLIGNNLYFTTISGSLMTTDLKTMKTEVIVQNKFNIEKTPRETNQIMDFAISGDNIYTYQIEPEGIYRYSGSSCRSIYTYECTCISPGLCLYFLTVYNNKLYFAISENRVLMRYDPVTDEVSDLLSLDGLSDYNFAFDSFFYEIDGELYRLLLE